MEVSDQIHVPAALTMGEKSSHYQLNRKLCGRSGAQINLENEEVSFPPRNPAIPRLSALCPIHCTNSANANPTSNSEYFIT